MRLRADGKKKKKRVDLVGNQNRRNSSSVRAPIYLGGGKRDNFSIPGQGQEFFRGRKKLLFLSRESLVQLTTKSFDGSKARDQINRRKTLFANTHREEGGELVGKNLLGARDTDFVFAAIAYGLCSAGFGAPRGI